MKSPKVSINRNDSRSAKDVPSANLYDFPVNVKEETPNVKEEIPEINDAMMKNDLFIMLCSSRFFSFQKIEGQSAELSAEQLSSSAEKSEEQ